MEENNIPDSLEESEKEEEIVEDETDEFEEDETPQEDADEKKIFKKFKVKDVVFLAIVSAVILLTSAIMPLIKDVPLFGIIELCLGLQFSLFPAIGLMKVRKPGALLFMAVCSGIVLVFMFPPMFFCLLFCAIVCEALTLLIFRGYKKNVACWFSAMLYMPLTLPFLYAYYHIVTVDSMGAAVAALSNPEPLIAALMSIAVLALCALGSFIGVKISKELQKAGVMKK